MASASPIVPTGRTAEDQGDRRQEEVVHDYLGGHKQGCSCPDP